MNHTPPCPLMCVPRQSCRNRVLLDIITFFLQVKVRPDSRMEETYLPAAIWSADVFGELVFPPSYPTLNRHALANPPGRAQKVQVIRHEHVVPDQSGIAL